MSAVTNREHSHLADRNHLVASEWPKYSFFLKALNEFVSGYHPSPSRHGAYL